MELSLIDGLLLKENCSRKGFNINTEGHSLNEYLKVRIGIIANMENECLSCDSCIGFGTSMK